MFFLKTERIQQEVSNAIAGNPCGQALCECDQKIVECWANVSTTPPSERLECIEPKSSIVLFPTSTTFLVDSMK